MITHYIKKKKRSIHLVKYECGMYAVEKITKAAGVTLFASDSQAEAIEFFNNY